MGKITIEEISKLREETGLGVMDVKKALEEASGDYQTAKKALAKSDAGKAAKKSERNANNGRVEAYLHGDGKIGVLVEVSSETDFVARNADFKEFVHFIALQIAANDPKYVKREEIPTEIIIKKKSELQEDLKDERKPAEIIEKIIAGRMEKYYTEVCLLDQLSIKDPEITVLQYLNSMIAKIGEKIEIKRFARYAIGC